MGGKTSSRKRDAACCGSRMQRCPSIRDPSPNDERAECASSSPTTTASTRRASTSASEIARALSDDVWVVAPETDQSGVSHSLSLNDPLRLREVGDARFAVKGTPTDCVIMGVRHIMKDNPPDLVLSGVNRGQQHRRGRDLFRHGRGRDGRHGPRHSVVRAVAGLSVAQRAASRIGTPRAQHGPTSSAACSTAGIPRGVLVNINFPDCAPDEVQGHRGHGAGQARPGAAADRARATTGAAIRTTGSRSCARSAPTPGDGTDLSALADNRIAVTPLRLDMTDEPFMTKLAALFR